MMCLMSTNLVFFGGVVQCEGLAIEQLDEDLPDDGVVDVFLRRDV